MRAPHSESNETHAPQPRGGYVVNVLPAVFYIVCVFVAGSLPLPLSPGVGKLPLDKVAHAVGFAIMQVLVFRGLRYEFEAWSRSRALICSALLASAIGGLLELHQAALPHRTADFVDFLADALGAVIAGFIVGNRQETKKNKGDW